MKLKNKRKVIKVLLIGLLLFFVGMLVRSFSFNMEEMRKGFLIGRIGSYIQMIGVLMCFWSLFVASKDLNSK